MNPIDQILADYDQKILALLERERRDTYSALWAIALKGGNVTRRALAHNVEVRRTGRGHIVELP